MGITTKQFHKISQNSFSEKRLILFLEPIWKFFIQLSSWVSATINLRQLQLWYVDVVPTTSFLIKQAWLTFCKKLIFAYISQLIFLLILKRYMQFGGGWGSWLHCLVCLAPFSERSAIYFEGWDSPSFTEICKVCTQMKR